MISNKRNDSNPQYSKYFRSFLPISFYPQYSLELELSDRIILPKSVLLDISRLNIPSPYLFILRPERVYRSPIYCAPLYFTAEEDVIYLPMILIKRLGFKAFKQQMSHNKPKNGVYLQSLPLKSIDPLSFSNSLWYILPRCQKVKVFVSRTLPIERIRRGLVNYSVLKEGEDIKIANGKEIVFVYIIKLYPADTCIISETFFEVEIADYLPRSPREKSPNLSPKNDERKNSALGILEFPEKSPKLPKFLNEILHNRVSSSFCKKREKSPNPYLIYENTSEEIERPTTTFKHKFYHSKAISMDNEPPLSISTAYIWKKCPPISLVSKTQTPLGGVSLSKIVEEDSKLTTQIDKSFLLTINLPMISNTENHTPSHHHAPIKLKQISKEADLKPKIINAPSLEYQNLCEVLLTKKCPTKKYKFN